MSVDDKTVRKVAKLSRIAIRDDEVAPMTDKLNGILAWIEQLNEVDIDGVDPMTTPVPMTQPLRDDVVTDGGMAAAVTQNAPKSDHNFFVVPKVVE